MFLQRSSMGVVSGPGGKRGKVGNKSELMEKKTVDKVEKEPSVEMMMMRRGSLLTRQHTADPLNIFSCLIG